jgi:hypothetical protein
LQNTESNGNRAARQNGFVIAHLGVLIPQQQTKMPRNTTGGSGHKSQRNSEGSKARHNREHIDDLLDDYRKNEDTKGVYVGRILRRMGNGRMEVLYFRTIVLKDDDEMYADPTKKTRIEMVQQIIPMCGGLRGKAKKTVWVDIDSLVMLAETGLAGATHEIIAVFSPEQVARYRKLFPHADERLFLKSGNGDEAPEESGITFDEEDEVNVDDI